MREITLAAVPNQSFSVSLDNRRYDFTIKEAKGVMAATLARDGVIIVSGMRLAAGTPILPYKYQEAGNFIILTSNGDYPYYTAFGVTQTLIYASQVELEVIRGI